MKRGVVKLEMDEVNGLADWLKQGSANVGGLIQRVENALNDNLNETSVQLSEEEVELLMDALPAPGENEVLTNVRFKLQNFLIELRSE